MKKYLCKSLALSMAVLNLCNHVSVLGKDIQQENVTNDKSNFKSYAIKGAKVVGGISVAALAMFGAVGIVRDAYSRLKNSTSKKESMERFLSVYPMFDKNMYDSVFKVFHSSDFTEEDLKNFHTCIYKISTFYSDPDLERGEMETLYTNKKMSIKRFSNKFEVNSTEFKKFYYCARYIYDNYFLPCEDSKHVCVDYAIYTLLNSDFYMYELIDEQARDRVIYCDLVDELLKNGIMSSIPGARANPTTNIDGHYLEKFCDRMGSKTCKLTEAEIVNFCSNVQVIELQISDIRNLRLKKYIANPKNVKNDDAIIKCGNKLLVRVGSYKIPVSRMIELLETCKKYFKEKLEPCFKTSASAPALPSPSSASDKDSQVSDKGPQDESGASTVALSTTSMSSAPASSESLSVVSAGEENDSKAGSENASSVAALPPAPPSTTEKSSAGDTASDESTKGPKSVVALPTIIEYPFIPDGLDKGNLRGLSVHERLNLLKVENLIEHTNDMIEKLKAMSK